MANVSEIMQADSYTGDANLGGANAPAMKLDTEPLRQLALYTQFYHKNMYDQAIKDRDAKIADLAPVATIDLNNTWGKDKAEITKQLNDLKQKAATYARNPNRTVEDELQWQTDLGKVMDNYNSAKQRALTYQSQVNDINADTTRTDAQKKILLKALDDKFNSTDLSTPISSATGYKPVDINLPNPVVSNTTAIKVSADKNLATTNNISYFNPLASASAAMNAVNGVNALLNQTSGVDKELQATSAGEAQTWAGMKNTINAVLAAKDANGNYKYFDQGGQFQYDKFKQDNASNTAIMMPVDAMMNLTKYSKQHQNELTQGMFSDQGVNYNAPKDVNADTFAPGIINITPDGVQANQLALAGMYAKYTGDTNAKKMDKLGLGIEQQNVDVEKGKLALGWAGYDLNKDKWKAAQGAGTDAMKSTALDKANTIYNELKSLADPNGVISPDKMRQLNSEQLKFLGRQVPAVMNDEGQKVQEAGFQPLSLKKDEATDKGNTKNLAIKLENGHIKVMHVNSTYKLKDGTTGYAGIYDPDLSTSVTNVATNVLNEEVKNAGGKEINSYTPLNEATNNGEGQTQSSSNGQAQADPTMDSNPSNWTQLSNGNYQYKDGSIYNSKGKKIK